MRPLIYENVNVDSELAYRLLKSYARLEGKEYRPESIFGMDQHGWPGDWEGRTILALVLLARATGRKPAFLKRRLNCLEEEVNERGYLKGIMPEGEADEQQLSGHSWLLRGLLEYYLWTGERKCEKRIKEIVKNLYLPVKGMYGNYPLKEKVRKREGGEAGNLQEGVVNGWHLSSDIGCSYICMDGLSQYYEVFRDPEVEELLDEMCENFQKIDFLGASMQTHASLTACRGVLRYYRCTGRKELLDFSKRLFDYYQDYGMTENYANFNWFGRPYWTEPCAVIDSYMIAMQLFMATGEHAYLDIANRIYFNGICHGQRFNGGFGCDFCAGAQPVQKFLGVKEKAYEAYWCCSMRGVEGLTYAAVCGVLEDGKDMYITGPASGTYTDGNMSLQISSDDWIEGRQKILVTKCTSTEINASYENAFEKDKTGENAAKEKTSCRIFCYLPENCDEAVTLTRNGLQEAAFVEKGWIVISAEEGDVLEVAFRMGFQVKPPVSKTTDAGFKTYWHGVQMLGVHTVGSESGVAAADEPAGQEATMNEETLTYLGKGVYTDGVHMLRPFGDSIYLEKRDLIRRKVQVLF